MWTVAQLSADLAAGRITSRDLVEQALARIAAPEGEGARAFLKLYTDTARAEAEFSDRLRRAGIRRSPVDGLPVSLKDLFDVAGDVTRAGSKIHADAPPAKADAPAVARLRAAGAVILGRTNMVEFAFGGVGLNPHFGTPKNPYDRKTGRVPGGSSSGAAVAQADGMCVMALGSDTRGSIRQPAALCGVAGFKPTARRVPREGAFPLSLTLDSIGPLANSAACCAMYDAILAREPPLPLPEMPAKGLRLLLPRSSALEDLDPQVGKAFDLLAEYDPRVGKRVLFGKDISGPDYVLITELRAAYIREVEALAAPFDAIVMPSVPCVAPAIAETERSDEDYFRWNFRIMRNTGLINFLDGCALTLPCHAKGTAPVGLMVCGPAMSDRRILAVAAAVEQALSGD